MAWFADITIVEEEIFLLPFCYLPFVVIKMLGQLSLLFDCYGFILLLRVHPVGP